MGPGNSPSHLAKSATVDPRHPVTPVHTEIGRWHESFRDIEVLARPIGFFFREFERLGHSTDSLLADISLTRDQLTKRHGRIDWETMRILMRNVGRAWDTDELIEAGRRMTDSRWINPFALVARLLYSAEELYRWNFRPMTGGSAQFFTCIENSVTELGPGEIRVETWMAPGYEPSPELFQMFRGTLIQMPQLLCLGPAKVEFHEHTDGTVHYDIEYPTGGGRLARVRRALVGPFFAKNTARELEVANELLLERHGELARQTRELSQAATALVESDDRFRKVFRASPTAIIMAGLDGRIIDVNDIFVKASGYSRDELCGFNTSDFSFWKNPAMREHLVEMLANGKPVRGIEVELCPRSGDARVVLLSAERTVFGAEPCIIWNSVDITDRKKAEEENRILQERIIQAQKLESLGVLAGGIAHDFNNLLVGMLGNAELALNELGPGSEHLRERIEAIRLASERAADLTNEMLVCAGKTKSAREPLDLAALVAETATLLNSGLPKSVVLDYQLHSGPIWVDGDATQLRQVVMNLMTNAAESFEDASGRVDIRTTVVDADRKFLNDAYSKNELAAARYAMVEVKDSGCGMDPETLKRIFDPFFTTKFTGRGLGLAATLGIVRGHDGALRVRSEVSQGTCFQILLPMSDARPKLETGAAPSAMHHGTALIVDDEPSVRQVTQTMLERIGYEVLEADSGESALDVIRDRGDSLAAVVLDLTMPGMGGDETFHAIRKLDPTLPVLCCSGHGDEIGTKWLEGKHCVGFIGKPFLLEELRSGLATLYEPAAVV